MSWTTSCRRVGVLSRGGEGEIMYVRAIIFCIEWGRENSQRKLNKLQPAHWLLSTPYTSATSARRSVTVDCMLGYDADMMTVEFCRGFR